MKQVIIDGYEVRYLPEKEIKTENNTFPFYEMYPEFYGLIHKICNILDVPCPHVGIYTELIRYSADGAVNYLGGITYSPNDVPELDRHLILIALGDKIKPCYTNYEITGSIVHELRHIWQDYNSPEIRKKNANGLEKSLYHSAEIDADGFAIWYLSHFGNMSYEVAGRIMCPTEYKNFKTAFKMRLDQARHLSDEFKFLDEEKPAEQPISFRSKLKIQLNKLFNN